MKRLPLILAVILGGISFIIILPILIILWLLGANEVFSNYTTFLTHAILDEDDED